MVVAFLSGKPQIPPTTVWYTMQARDQAVAALCIWKFPGGNGTVIDVARYVHTH